MRERSVIRTEDIQCGIEVAVSRYYAAERRAGSDPDTAHQRTDEFRKRLIEIAKGEKKT